MPIRLEMRRTAEGKKRTYLSTFIGVGDVFRMIEDKMLGVGEEGKDWGVVVESFHPQRNTISHACARATGSLVMDYVHI